MSHEQLHTLHGVVDLRGLVQVNTHGALKSRHQLESRDRCHTLDWETDLSQVKLAAENLLADHLHNLSSSASESLHEDLISAFEAS